MTVFRDPDSAARSCFEDGWQERGDEVGLVSFGVEDESIDAEVCGEIYAFKDLVLGGTGDPSS